MISREHSSSPRIALRADDARAVEVRLAGLAAGRGVQCPCPSHQLGAIGLDRSRERPTHLLLERDAFRLRAT
jgi:hypothetical protein